MAIVGVYRRQLQEMRLALDTLRGERSSRDPTAQLQKQVEELALHYASAKAELVRLKEKAQNSDALRAGSEPRMSPTLLRMPLPSDVEVWANRPKKAPTFAELNRQLYGQPSDEERSVVNSFTNPYNLTPHMKYPHSSLWLKGDVVMDRIFQELGLEKVKFVVEAGSMHGGSAIRMAIELDKRGLRDVPILCIDPWTGDLNMWLNRVVWDHLNIHDGRSTTYDQFMVNVQQAIVEGNISPHHITPFPVSSIIGARWLQATGFTPSLIYLDSAHEIDETYYELCLFYDLLELGGILMGDDYGWRSVKLDVDRFVRDKGLQLNMFGVYYNWFVKKPDS
eukprot:CAMPEP_0117482412 /NCGR_PEP_ID=MMETSP0784-20121206/13404_1 /TAXON_ID=39447 /ORGANISM="" /LENGTH=335 /DNA_ID=CAMNT_0005276903 /DNA_START=138 /DNA_END=1145 /DNA_ORIENTATION=+